MSYIQRPEDIPAPYDPRGKIWLLQAPHIAQKTWQLYHTNTPLWIPPPFYNHHVLVLDWAETRGWVKIAMASTLIPTEPSTDIQKLAASVPPVEQVDPDDYFIILGKSDKKPGPHEVKWRLNPYWEDVVRGCYVRLDWICCVPLAILTWWTERWWDPWPGPQLMLQDPSFEKLQAYLERKERCNVITDLKKQYVGDAITGPQGKTSHRSVFCPGEDLYCRNMED